jgi:hypothetical protein
VTRKGEAGAGGDARTVPGRAGSKVTLEREAEGAIMGPFLHRGMGEESVLRAGNR